MDCKGKAMIDENLVAYLDDELDPEQRSRLTRQITSEADAADRLSLFTQADSQLRRAFAIGPVEQGDPLAAKLRSSHGLRVGSTRDFWQRIGTLAAACVLGVFIGVAFTRSAPPSGVGHLGSAIADALETAPSGQSRTFAGGEIELAQTIRTDHGYCREARVTAVRGASDILACRQGGAWILAASVTLISNPSRTYEAAGAQTSLLDLALNERGSPAYVELSEESQLISTRWSYEPDR
mgnify:CR=1 FL=1